MIIIVATTTPRRIILNPRRRNGVAKTMTAVIATTGV
jgi:hypothetical protein